MISRETEELLRRLLAEQPVYKPADDVLKQVQEITMLCFVGASCMGKTTVMQLLAQTDKAYGITRNFTSRAPREGDDPDRYVYFEHSDAGLRPILNRIASRELLQYNIHPFSLHVYGSEIEGYPHRYNMGDIFYSSIDGFRQLGFKKLYAFSIITEPASWQRRFEARFPEGNPHRSARLAEAIESLEWSLSQTAADHIWVINRDDACEIAVYTVRQAMSGQLVDQAEARQFAEKCLTLIKELSRV